MRHLAMTGMETESMISETLSGSAMRARPRLTRAPPVSTFPSLMMRCYPRRPLPEGDGALHLALPRRNQFDPGGPLVEHEGIPPPRLEDDFGSLLLGPPRA